MTTGKASIQKLFSYRTIHKNILQMGGPITSRSNDRPILGLFYRVSKICFDLFYDAKIIAHTNFMG